MRSGTETADFATLRDDTLAWGGAADAWRPLADARRAVADADLVDDGPSPTTAERPLLVAMFGGTGTGKSSLATAIAGADVAVPGTQRPTTKRPTLIVHGGTDAAAVWPGVADAVDVVTSDNDAFLDFALLDCPDPDTDGRDVKGTDAAETDDDAGETTNLGRLRAMLPHCDVLIVTATQQKYRSARVLDELREAGAGLRMLFVQTHAGLDEDIRDDWSRHLASVYEVPDVYLVDSVDELDRHRAGEPHGPEFTRLLATLGEELSARSRGTVRLRNRAHALRAAVRDAREACGDDPQETLRGVLRTVDEQQRRVTDEIVGRLRDELRDCRGLWEQRLMAAVADRWGASPFSAALKVYGGLGGILSSFALLRARGTAQLAVAGVMSGARMLKERRERDEREEKWEQAILGGPDEALLEEARLIVADAADRAGLDVDDSAETARVAALNAYEHDLVEATGKQVEQIIEELAATNARAVVRWPYELALGGYLLFVVYRVVTNFFWDSFLAPGFFAREPAALLGFEFYVAAAVLLALWAGLLVGLFSRRLRRGLGRHIDRMAEQLVGRKLPHSLFPTLRSEIAAAEAAVAELDALNRRAAEFVDGLPATRLGGRV
ncbi:MAG: hypothetical protein AAF532_08145 [Planctomycetota bacterium]